LPQQFGLSDVLVLADDAHRVPPASPAWTTRLLCPQPKGYTRYGLSRGMAPGDAHTSNNTPYLCPTPFHHAKCQKWWPKVRPDHGLVRQRIPHTPGPPVPGCRLDPHDLGPLPRPTESREPQLRFGDDQTFSAPAQHRGRRRRRRLWYLLGYQSTWVYRWPFPLASQPAGFPIPDGPDETTMYRGEHIYARW